MVELGSKLIYICRICKQEYDSIDDASKCESKEVFPKYQREQIVKAISLKKPKGWPLFLKSEGGFLETRNLEDAKFIIEQVGIELGTHNIVYLIKEITSENHKKGHLDFKKQIEAGPESDEESELYLHNKFKELKHMSDEQVIDYFTAKFYVPEESIRSLEEKLN